MLTSSTAQYLHPDYLQPLPTTVGGAQLFVILLIYRSFLFRLAQPGLRYVVRPNRSVCQRRTANTVLGIRLTLGLIVFNSVRQTLI